MNKHIWKWAVAGLTLVATACTSNPEEVDPTPVLGKYSATIKATTAEGTLDGTRVSYYDGVGVEWNVGEQIGLASVGLGGDGERHQFYSAALTEEDITKTEGHRYQARFSIGYDSGGDYYVFHPRKEGVNYAQGPIPFEVVASQTQLKKGNMDGGICMVGKSTINLPEESGTQTDIDVKFKVVNTVLRFEIYAGAELNETITEVSIETPNNVIAGTMTALLSVNTENEVEAECTMPAEGGHKVTVAVDDFPFVDQVPTAYEDGRGIYAAILPCEVAANAEGSVIYTVKTRAHIYTFKSTMKRSYEGGKYYAVKLNLANATSVAENESVPEHLYIMGGALEVNSWDPADAVELTKVEGENTFTGKVVLKSGESFRFITQKEGNNSYYIKGANDNEVRFSLNEPQGSEYNFSVEKSALYEVTVNLTDAENGTMTLATTTPDRLYLTGNVVGSPVELTKGEGNVFSTELWLSEYVNIDDDWKLGAFCFIAQNDDTDHNYYKKSEDNAVAYSYAGDAGSNFEVKSFGKSGKYRVTVTLAADGQTGTVAVELLRPENLYIFGNAVKDLGSNTWSSTKKMTYYDGDGGHKFYTVRYLHADSLYRFATHEDGDLHTFNYANNGDGKVLYKLEVDDAVSWNFTSPNKAGVYEITVDFDNEGAVTCVPATPCLIKEGGWENDPAKRPALTRKGDSNVYYTYTSTDGWYKFAKTTTSYITETYGATASDDNNKGYSDYWREGSDLVYGGGNAGNWLVPGGQMYYLEIDLDNNHVRAIPTVYYMAGGAAGWDWDTLFNNGKADNGVKFDTFDAANCRAILKSVTWNTGLSFKIYSSHAWNWDQGIWFFAEGSDNGNEMTLGKPYNVVSYYLVEQQPSEGDNQWKLAEGGTYSLTLDLSNFPTVKLIAGEPIE